MSTEIKVKQSCIRTIKSSDPRFYIGDGIVTAPRAGFEISQTCPEEYRMIIMTALQYGYVKPVANIRDTELFWESLQ